MMTYTWIGALEITGNPLAYGVEAIYEMVFPSAVPAGALIFVSNNFVGGGNGYQNVFLGDTVGNNYVAVTGGGVAYDCLPVNAGEKLRFRLGNYATAPADTVVNLVVFAFAVSGDTVRLTTNATGFATLDNTGSGSNLSATPRWRQMNTEYTALKPVLLVTRENFLPGLGLTCGDISRGSTIDPEWTFDFPYSCSGTSWVDGFVRYGTRNLSVASLLLLPGLSTTYHVRYEWTPDPFLIPDANQLTYYIYEEVPNLAIAFARSPADRRLVLAAGTDAAAVAYRYSDALPEVAGLPITVDAGATQAVAVHYARDTRLLYLFAQDGVVGYRTSFDQGRTWTNVVTVATGYEDIAQHCDDGDGLWAVALYKQSENRWYLSVGTLNEAGDTWTFSTPVALVNNARRAGDLDRRRDGVWEFAYINTLGAAVIVRSVNLTATGGGTWS